MPTIASEAPRIGRRTVGAVAGAALALAVIAITFGPDFIAPGAGSTDGGIGRTGGASPAPATAAGEGPTAGDPALPGGATTASVSGTNAFSQPAANLSFGDRVDFSVGNSFFRNPWVSAPASTDARDGLGPLFNTNACQGCHIKDGRGRPPAPDAEHAVSTLVRLGSDAPLPRAASPARGVTADPAYGAQLQDFALPDVAREARIVWEYRYETVSLADGETVELRRPEVRLEDLAYGPLHPDTRLGPRVAPAMIGLGLLEAIPESAIVAAADPQDADGDGISGRPNRVFDVARGSTALGRFGWKAEQPTIRQQSAAAFLGDMGLTTPLFPEAPCTPAQAALCDLPDGGSPEVAPEILDAVTFYASHLAPPRRRDTDAADVRAGEALFRDAGCAACHTPRWETGDGATAALSGQVIFPYTDLLLHDMGEGLADGLRVFDATGREWRTPPLWGLGRHEEVNGNAFFLHDGRARDVLEAILWHGGEAQSARDRVANMSAQARARLVAFLESL
jgi:CxxC motif-containing protein (DUF1111 family)